MGIVIPLFQVLKTGVVTIREVRETKEVKRGERVTMVQTPGRRDTKPLERMWNVRMSSRREDQRFKQIDFIPKGVKAGHINHLSSRNRVAHQA